MENQKLRCERKPRGCKKELSDFILWFSNHPNKDELARSSKQRIQNLYESESGKFLSFGPIHDVLQGKYMILDNKIYKLYATIDEGQE